MMHLRIPRGLFPGVVAGFVLSSLLSVSASAQTTLKVGFLKTYGLLPLFEAQAKGYFKQRGLDVEFITLNNGPAVAAAISSGSLDIGYSAFVPIAAARSRGEDYRFFVATGFESAKESITKYVASGRSGMSSFKDLAGKTIAINASGGGCELGALDHAESAGLAPSAFKIVTMPFPQMQASLELGTIDAACTVDPFFASIMNSPKIGAKLLATSPIGSMSATPVMVDGFFAREGWLAAHKKEAADFVAALQAGAQDVKGNRGEIEKLLVAELKFSPEIAAKVQVTPVAESPIDPASMKALLDAMARRGFVAKPVLPQDLIAGVK